VQRIDERTLRVVVDVTRGGDQVDDEVDDQVDDQVDQRLVRANDVIDSDHPAIVALLAGAKLSPTADRRAQADTLRTLVARHISSKNLGSAFASASEAAISRSGDCTEHAVLLAALLRAAGIPSRVASGLVYVPPFAGRSAGWGWHLWTQAFVNLPGQDDATNQGWVDFDATQPPVGPRFHPAHVVVATSDLAGGATDPAFARALSFVGTVTIEEVTEGSGVSDSKPAKPIGASSP
jgi:transglutaminase-like putative cysteine protease